MKRAIGYIRVSTEVQAVEGVSLAAQEMKIRAWCELNDYELEAVFVDAGVSGKRADNRPGLQSALAQCGRGSALVVYSLTRLARSTKDTLQISERLERIGADLVSLSERIDTTTAAGKMVFRMLAVLAEFERDQVSERTRAALDHKRVCGERIGAIPYGYRLSVNGYSLIPHPGEQPIVRMVRELRAQGLSYRAIAAALDKAGYRSRGKGWHPQTVKNIAEAA